MKAPFVNLRRSLSDPRPHGLRCPSSRFALGPGFLAWLAVALFVVPSLSVATHDGSGWYSDAGLDTPDPPGTVTAFGPNTTHGGPDGPAEPNFGDSRHGGDRNANRLSPARGAPAPWGNRTYAPICQAPTTYVNDPMPHYGELLEDTLADAPNRYVFREDVGNVTRMRDGSNNTTTPDILFLDVVWFFAMPVGINVAAGLLPYEDTAYNWNGILQTQDHDASGFSDYADLHAAAFDPGNLSAPRAPRLWFASGVPAEAHRATLTSGLAGTPAFAVAWLGNWTDGRDGAAGGGFRDNVINLTGINATHDNPEWVPYRGAAARMGGFIDPYHFTVAELDPSDGAGQATRSAGNITGTPPPIDPDAPGNDFQNNWTNYGVDRFGFLATPSNLTTNSSHVATGGATFASDPAATNWTATEDCEIEISWLQTRSDGRYDTAALYFLDDDVPGKQVTSVVWVDADGDNRTKNGTVNHVTGGATVGIGYDRVDIDQYLCASCSPLELQRNPDGSFTAYIDADGSEQIDPGEALYTTPNESVQGCAKKLVDFLHDFDAYDHLFVVEPGFDPATEYDLPNGTSFVTWSVEDYLCLVPEHPELENATVSPVGLLLDAQFAASMVNATDPTGSYWYADVLGVQPPLGSVTIPGSPPAPPSLPEPPEPPMPSLACSLVASILDSLDASGVDPTLIPQTYRDKLDECSTSQDDFATRPPAALPPWKVGPGPQDPDGASSAADPGLPLGSDLPLDVAGSYSIGFDAGSAPDWMLQGLWHVSGCQSYNAPYSLAFKNPNCPGNFNTGARTQGAAWSPQFSIPSNANSAKLTWRSWHHTEYGSSYDHKKVEITTNNGGSWTLLLQESGPQQTWNARNADLVSYKGQTIRFRFFFDSQDSLYNDGQGWFIDDVQLNIDAPAPGGGDTPAAPSLSESFDSGAAPGWSLTGLWHTSSCRSHSVSYALAYNRPTCPTDFDVGTTSGDAITPPVDVPANANQAALSWLSWYETEASTYYDQKRVYVSNNGGASWVSVWQEEGPERTWVVRSIDLTPYKGQSLRFRFHFNSIDSAFNGFEGWYVDNVVVSSGVPTSAGTASAQTHGTSTCPGGTYTWTTGTPGMCDNVRRGSYNEIVITVVTPRWDHPQYPYDGCNYGNTRKAADVLAQVAGVPFRVSCDWSSKWNPDQPAGATNCVNSNGDWNWERTEDGTKLLNRAYKYGLGKGFVSHPAPSNPPPPRNMSMLAWVIRADNHGLACNGAHPAAMAAEYKTQCDCRVFPRDGLALHELAHLFAADHVPDDGWKKNVCSTWHQHDWNYGHWHNYHGVMNYCRMKMGDMYFDDKNHAVVVHNIKDDAPNNPP